MGWPLVFRFAVRSSEAAFAALDAITPGTGSTDDAKDVLALTALFRAISPRVAGLSAITEDVLTSAEPTRRRISRELEVREDLARDLRWRAYTAWLNDYSDLARTGR